MSDRQRAGKRKRKRKLPSWTHAPVYQAVRMVSGAMHVLGPDRAGGAMAALGSAYASLPMNRGRLDRARENIRWCFPEFDAERVERYARQSYRHLFTLAAEISLAPRVLTVGSYSRHVEFGDVEPALREALQDHPILLVTGHTGNWEVLGYALAMLGFPISAVYRPLDMAPVDRWVRQTRERRGLMLLDKFGAAMKLPSVMERHELVGFIADQNAGDRGMFVPFFGRLASAYKTIGVMAMRYNAAVVCGQALRVGEDGQTGATSDFRYKVQLYDTILPDAWAGRPDPLFYITARYRRAIEEMVRRAPEQYLWMHRYWKSRPRHERRGEAFPDRLRDKLAELPWMDGPMLDRIVERSACDAEEFARRPAGRARGD